MRGDKELVEIHLLLSPSIKASESHSSEMQREARRIGHDCGPHFGMDKSAPGPESHTPSPSVKQALIHQLPPLSHHRLSPRVAEIPDSQGRATTDTHNWEPASLVLISASIFESRVCDLGSRHPLCQSQVSSSAKGQIRTVAFQAFS